MPKSKQQKEQDLQELTAKLKKAKAVVLSDYRGTSVKDMDSFRKAMRENGVFAKVYKMTLVNKALKEAGIEGSVKDHKAPVVLSISEGEETAPARSVKGISKEVKSIKILEGVLDGRVVEDKMVLTLAGLPSKDELRAQVVRTINAPVSGFVNVLAGNLRGFINVLNAMASK